MGRLVSEDPAAGHGAETEYVYNPAASSTDLADVAVRRIDEAGTGVLAESAFEFDGFGRAILERREMPGLEWVARDTEYDALGRKSQISEWYDEDPPGTKHWTQYLDYDAFGRAGRIRPPDGSTHDVTVAYKGVRQVSRTVKIATGASGGETAQTRIERYDRQGRLYQVVEDSGVGGAAVTTTYGYDVGNRLASVQTVAGVTQNRSFVYDHRGFLLSETHPEKSAAVTYSGYDALGNAGRKVDGTSDLTFTYDPDSAVATRTTRDGVVVTYGYDAANNVVSAVPSVPSTPPASLAPLDAGDFTDYDVLARPTAHRRGRSGLTGADPRLGVAYTGYDLAGRLEAEVLGGREPLSRGYDVWSRPTELGLPSGLAAVSGLERGYDTLDRLTAIGAVGHATAGADLAWGGGRLYGITTRGALGTAARYGYIGGPGLERAGQGDASLWKLGTLSWGAGGTDVTQPPAVLWDTFSYGYRGSEGDARDGLKIGRTVEHPQGLGLFAGMGWSWGYDAATRLTMAELGPGSLEGFFSPDAAERWSYGFGEGDELERVIREEAAELVTYESGPDGRVTSRAGEPIHYDAVGRRIEDDRATYRWSWRGELVEATLKPTVDSPYAGHQVRWLYDATGRLTARDHYGPLPEGEVADSQRPFIERRAFLWDGWTRLGEAGYADPDETQLRWRITYLPGPSGLDDALQALVEVVDVPGSPYVGKRLYTYLRDEMGSVVGVVAEDESGAVSSPPVPVRYRHSPYGETDVGARDGFTDGVPIFDTVAASSDAVGGRFPGGQNLLFQGLWIDPVVGIAYARHRWLDVRDGVWLSEDRLDDLDSPNLYAYIAHDPANGRDPLGLVGLNKGAMGVSLDLEEELVCSWGFLQGVAGSLTMGVLQPAQPSTEDTAVQRACQSAGATLVAIAGVNVGGSGTATLGASVVTGPAAPAAAGAGGAMIITGGYLVGGAGVYLSEAANVPVSASDRENDAEADPEAADNSPGEKTRSLDDLESLRGATPEEIRDLIPENWVEKPLRKGEGTRFLNPDRRGEALMIEKGWPAAIDPLHEGPYLRVSREGKVIRIPLAGNPVLEP